ncbi:MAG: class I SAM-dependent methyltransferase [Rhizobiaceae bacterium]
MDGVYRWQRYIYDASRKFYLLGRDRLVDELAVPACGTVLEIGCGTGRNLILAARRYPHASFFGLDISAEMLATAHGNIRRASLDKRVSLARADATRFDADGLFGQRSFDRVFISYALSMIPGWEQAVAAGVAVLSPGGSLHVADFGGQEHMPHWCRSALRAWLTRFHVTPRDDLGTLMEGIATQGRRTFVARPLYRGYAWLGTIGPVTATP